MYPGEYTQPLVRKTLVQVPVISGYVTSRLQAQDYYPPTISGTPAMNMLVTLENTGANATTVLLRETNDDSISGVRFTIMNAVTLVRGGMTTQFVNKGYLPIIELFCSGSDATTGQTQSSVRMQIDAQRRWTEMAFAKDDPFYPPQLFQAKEFPGPLS